ncbi:cupin domain-containing protein [Adhaeribacter radiodurans]|uniref:Cupin domain-containing protein n=1 Tax=Adhaeribacter radiodurans TaxID=2745197 RepID=A0A7L7L238_9BACT|nr:cupin domain-containing protein [Adhaeribacter radiodurans]QMU26645.1 cupin domain-containing protein [Adhaeribacter radiodurans]
MLSEPKYVPTDLENVTDQISYQPEKFSSKILLNNGQQKSILFAFTAGQELKTHTTPQPALLIMLEGTCLFQIKDGPSKELTAGEVIVIPADIPHSLVAVTNFKMILVK